MIQKRCLLLFSVLILMTGFIQAQRTHKTTAILIKGGHVIDPKNNIDEVMDVSIRDGKIARVSKNITAGKDELVINAAGMYVTPGLIDMHTHLFPGAGRGDPAPDGYTFRNGVTTAVDAGSSGWESFPDFKKETIDRSETRVLAWLNIVGEGFRGNREQDTSDMNSKLSADFARQNKEYIVGFKVAHYNHADWTPIDRAIEAGELAGGLPVMVDFGSAKPSLSLEELLMKKFRPGDVYTHVFGGNAASGTPAHPGGRESVVDLNGNLKSFVPAAQKRGIIFDVGFGGASFAFAYAVPALKSGFYPNTMGTDMNYHSINGAMKNILNVMSTFLALGMDLQSIIKAATWKPAQVINHEELGHLSVGSVADVAVLSIRDGNFGFWDKDNYKIQGKKKLECELTVRAGKIVYDFNGISIPNP